jgi:hypothetical protein
MPEPVDTPLRLHAKDLADLTIIAAAVQDALVPIGDIAWLRDEGRFVMVINRFRWETEEAARGKEPPVHERVHAGLRFDKVRKVQYRAIDQRNRGSYLELLTIAIDEDTVVLHFAGGGAIRLEVEELACVLGDLDEPWPTAWRPEHEERGEE